MRSSLWIPALLVGLSVAGAGEPARNGGAKDKERAEQLIKQLNSNKFAERERASGELEKLGMGAYEALKKAADDANADMETKARAGKILGKLQQQVESAAILAPTKLRLVLKDTPVIEAVKQLSQKSGYNIAVQGDVAKLSGRKVSLDTGETTFWQAFDQLCKEGGLVQMANPYGGIRFGNPPMIGPGGPIQIQPAPLPLLPPPPPGRAVPAPGKVAPQPAQKIDQAANAGRGQAAIVQAFAVQVAGNGQAVVVPVQVQAQPAIQPAFPGGGRIGLRPGGTIDPTGQLNVADGKAEKYPTHYAGAIRFRVLPYDRTTMSWIPDKTAGETLLILEVCAEPKLANFRIAGSPRVDKATDDQGQALSVSVAPMPGAVGGAIGGRPVNIAVPQPAWGNPYLAGTNRELVPIRLKAGEKQAKSLKELAGSVTAECLSPPQELVAIPDVLKAAGKSAKSKDGGSLELVEIAKQDDGNVRVKVRMEMVPGGNGIGGFGGAIQIMPGGPIRQIQIGGGIGGRPGMVGGMPAADGLGLPVLVDAKGKALQLVQIPARSLRGNGNVFHQEMTLVFRPQDGQGEPARLVLHGRRNAIVQAPFTFQGVTLP